MTYVLSQELRALK